MSTTLRTMRTPFGGVATTRHRTAPGNPVEDWISVWYSDRQEVVMTLLSDTGAWVQVADQIADFGAFEQLVGRIESTYKRRRSGER